MKIAANTVEQEERMFVQLTMSPPYSGPARDGSVFNTGDYVIVVDLSEPVNGDETSPLLMERKGKVLEINTRLEFSVWVEFGNQADGVVLPPVRFKDSELAIDEAALLKADEAAREYVA